MSPIQVFLSYLSILFLTICYGRLTAFIYGLLICRYTTFILRFFLFTKILCLNLLLWFLLIHFRSYQVLLESQAYEKCLLRAYSTRLTTFVFTVMVISASTSFLTRSHGRTHARTPGKPVYRGETGSPKNVEKANFTVLTWH